MSTEPNPPSPPTKPLGPLGKTISVVAFLFVILVVAGGISALWDKFFPSAPDKPAIAQTAASSGVVSGSTAESTCKGKTFNTLGLFDNPGTVTINQSSQRYKNLSDLLQNGVGSIEGYVIVGGNCYVRLNVAGNVNGGSFAGTTYALMN